MSQVCCNHSAVVVEHGRYRLQCSTGGCFFSTFQLDFNVCTCSEGVWPSGAWTGTVPPRCLCGRVFLSQRQRRDGDSEDDVCFVFFLLNTWATCVGARAPSQTLPPLADLFCFPMIKEISCALNTSGKQFLMSKRWIKHLFSLALFDPASAAPSNDA